GISGQAVHQPERDVRTVEGAAVTLDCSYDTSTYYIFWYKQEANGSPDFILVTDRPGSRTNAEKYRERFRCSMDASAGQAPLHIDSVKPSDSGVFYCVVRPTLTHPLACLTQDETKRMAVKRESAVDSPLLSAVRASARTCTFDLRQQLS
uniref:Ig-like domain-containing protein n=1 Tax=Hippocampus comes TaxID=109280 RepID=A0A3Q2YL90_HIPCM